MKLIEHLFGLSDNALETDHALVQPSNCKVNHPL